MYSLNRSRKILKSSYEWYLQKQPGLSELEQAKLKQLLVDLNEATDRQQKQEADRLARELEFFAKEKQKKTLSQYVREIFIALCLALIIATVVRASWFELYEIPTGSMRPNFREQDHLTVTKLPFGINIPLVTDHLLFDPNLVQRTSAVTFSGDQIPTINETTQFLGIFPYKKRLIKRLVGKPGDSLYFYGGKIYGVDQEGNPIQELLESRWLEKIEYIPFMKFSGDVRQTGPHEATFKQFGKTIGKVALSPSGNLEGSLWNGTEWIKDDPNAQKSPHDTIKTYSDWWGMRNYALSRLLTKKQLKEAAGLDPANIAEAPLYLELRHTPSLAYFKPELGVHKRGDLLLNLQQTVIPLQQEDLDVLMANMYTARLIFEKGHARRYSVEESRNPSYEPAFAKVPDGTYEFYFGKAYQVGLGAVTTLLPNDHPLYSTSPENVQKLYNLGIEMNTAYEPQSPSQPYYPSRYSYFRNGDLYTMGAPLLKKDSPVLKEFLKSEEKKEKQSAKSNPYLAFKDYGSPEVDGTLNTDFIRTFGITVPEKEYLVLGDNHAMSADSRIFGFVPEGNLQGAPSLILWPSGDRWGAPWQKPYPFMNLPRAVVWAIVLVITALWCFIQHRLLWKPIHI